MKAGKKRLDACGVQLNLTPTAAKALDGTLKTRAFTGGLAVGTAATHPRF